ncbi:PRC-barrel domain-containing protein [Microvirga zambiensis]|uniref:PRC-barrel domain-containing protein n=1 Tax=Microvirga zambiensis TaxID=1402137 RepID=UPI001FEB03A2|nr:PRC-barrel domain-containing protein [Microvirga zambiensis]
MVDTYQAGSSQERMRAEPRSSRTGALSQPPYLTHDLDTHAGVRRNVSEELRRRRRADLFFEDSIVLLSILLGGAVGYMTATTVRKSTWSSPPTRRSSQTADSSHFFGRQGRSRAEGSVEMDETTDLIASNKVEGTVVYNRQGEKLGEVYNFMVGKRSGEVAYAIMSFGGFLGIGQKYHPLPWNALTYDTNKKGYVIDADKERLMGAPSYQAGEEPFSWPEYGQQVRDYWSSDPT